MASPADKGRLLRVAKALGVRVATGSACRGHSAPIDFLAGWVYDRPTISLVCGPRGGGKSYLASLATHLDSIRYDRHGTRVLGGSLAQSQQIYSALRDFDRATPDAGIFASFTKTQATYTTGAEVAILAASSTSVRGPHVATLRLDEVDEIDPEIRESAMGMCMGQHGVPASVSMTSTWHRVGGPMASLIEQANAGAFPLHTFCTFEVLERCPAERSGESLEKCPECPLVKWCHDTDDGIPKAKRSSGHYAIDSLIQKVRSVSLRTFEADYLCIGPKADGLWFKAFDARSPQYVNVSAEYDPSLPVHVSWDSGVHTGAIFFQVRETSDGGHRITVFADFYAFDTTPERNARELIAISESLCQGRRDIASTDPAGDSRNAMGGPTVVAEYLRAGLCSERQLRRWPSAGGSVADGLALIEAFVDPANGPPGITIHPRCQHLIRAFQNYRRLKTGGQWQDEPSKDHPWSEHMDSLRGGLRVAFPEGRKPAPKLTYRPARSLF